MLFVKQLTMKCKSTTTNNRLTEAAKKIKECLKIVKMQEDMKNQGGTTTQELEQLTTNKAMRREVLDQVVIRPNIVGKKTLGALEIHQNGVRFSSVAGQKVDVCFSNVKHCFYQPCSGEE